MKPTVLMLPGTLCDERIFAYIKRTLRFEANLICGNYSGMKNRSTWISDLLSSMPSRFMVAGFSLGGLFALELARLAPQRVQGLALIASNGQAASDRIEKKSENLRRLWLRQGPKSVDRHVKPRYFHHATKRQRFERLVLDMATKTPRQSAFEEFAWAAQRPDGLKTLQHFLGPVLIVSGRQDKVCPRDLQQAMVFAQPHASWVEIDRCGHFLPLEAPAQLNRALRNWLTQTQSSVD